MIFYILYKIFNNIFFRLMTKKIGPVVYGNMGCKNFSIKSNCNIFFDTYHKTTHLGDRVFIIPILFNLQKNMIQISTNDNILIDLYEAIYKLKFDNNFDYYDFNIVLRPSFLKKFNRNIRQIYLDFTDTSTEYLISEQVNIILNKSLGLNQHLKNHSVSLNQSKDENSKIVFFSNYIDSGSFRKLFIDQKKLYDKCYELKRIGYKIYHIGTESDRCNDSKNYDFVDVDLRGKTSIIEIIELFKNYEDLIVVSYDNFLMHLGLIYNKKTFILFRGRFLKSNYYHHMKYVNCNFGKISGYL